MKKENDLQSNYSEKLLRNLIHELKHMLLVLSGDIYNVQKVLQNSNIVQERLVNNSLDNIKLLQERISTISKISQQLIEPKIEKLNINQIIKQVIKLEKSHIINFSPQSENFYLFGDKNELALIIYSLVQEFKRIQISAYSNPLLIKTSENDSTTIISIEFESNTKWTLEKLFNSDLKPEYLLRQNENLYLAQTKLTTNYSAKFSLTKLINNKYDLKIFLYDKKENNLG